MLYSKTVMVHVELWYRTMFWTLAAACFVFSSCRVASAALTGLALPPLELSPLQYGGSWASANSLVFTDLMKHSAAVWTFGTRAAGTNNSWGYLNPQLVLMRPDGYPAGLNATSNTSQWSAVTTIGKDGAYYTAGRYVVLYDGNGTVELRGDAAWPPVSSAPGRIVVDITPNTTGLSVRITSSSPSNPVVYIRIIPLANETEYEQNVFHPEFLAMLEGIPLLRYTAWMWSSWDPNNPRLLPRNWTSRTTPRHNSQVRESDGVAVEHLVQLANTVGANMWISVPRAANESDPYIYHMVSYIAANLSSNLTLTVEYGTDAPGWISSHLSNATRLISAVARKAWADAGRSRSQMRIVMTTSWQSPANTLANAGSNLSYIDAYALPGSFGGNGYWAWAGKSNPTYWGDPSYFGAERPTAPSLDTVMTYLRSSVIAADVGYYKSYQWLKSLGLDVLGYMAGPDMLGPLYGARSNYDRAMVTCGRNTTVFPCTWTTIYPPMGYSGGPNSINWTSAADFNITIQSMAPNASREAALESVLRQARMNGSLYDIVLDSLWRWHNQTGGGDIVIDLAKTAKPCSNAPGSSTRTYGPDECKGTPEAAALVVAKPTNTPTYQALKAWLAAVAVNGTAAAPGALPRSSADAPPPVPRPPACSPECVYGSCVNGSCVCWTGVSGATCDAVPSPGSGTTPSACNQRVGINLEGISDWSRSWTFVDVFKASRAWIPQTHLPSSSWSTGAPVHLINRTDGPGGRTAVGYPAVLEAFQKVSTLVERDLQAHAPGGVYTILYDGKGSLDFSLSDVKKIEFVEVGHVRVTFYPSTDFNNGLLVMVERTDPQDPIRNIRVLMPGYEQAAEWGDQPFHPAFLEFLRPFGLIRFMDWMESNVETLPTEWDERPRPEDISFASNLGGVPLEYMIKLVNMLGADPWFNMPFAASDDYITQFATAVRDGLRPDLRVYVEYGNELWHTGFPGGRYAQAMGLAMNLTEQGNMWYGGATNEARLCFVGQRTANISKIWKSVWGDRAAQVVVVVSGQTVWSITSDKLLSCGNASKNIDALAIGPYFGSYNAARDTNLTIFMNTTLPSQVNESTTLVKEHAAIAAKYGKPLLAYESGQGMTGDGSSTDLAIQANRDPAMYDVYIAYMQGLAAANVSRIVHFSSIGAFSRYGSWGLMEAQDADPTEAPKYQAVMSYINDTRTCSLPAPPDASKCSGPGCSGNGVCLSNGNCMCYSGFSGNDCSNITYVEVYNCGYKCTFEQGWCNVSTINKKTRTWSCTCKPNITGLTCSIVSCPNDCNWNGDCLDQGICACYPGYQGTDCSIDCGCGGHGRCAENSTSSCICDVGWKLGASGKCDEWDCRACVPGTSCIGPGECGCADTCVYGTCFHGTCRCWAGYGGPACIISEAEAAVIGRDDNVPRLNRGSLVGVNLPGTSYWSTEWLWVDLMKGSSVWMTANADDTSLEKPWDTGVPLDLRPDGYPARLPPNTVAHKLLQRNMLLHAWPGRYVILYDGEGRLDFGFDAKVASRAKGRMEIIFAPTANLACAATGAAYCGDNGIHLVLRATSPTNPLRNIRIVPSGEGAAASAGGAGAGGAWESRVERTPFHPWFLKSIARYRVIRFMPWMDTNNDDAWADVVAGNTSGWENRRKPNADTQAGAGGIALEYIVQLCNLIGADPWINVHHLADDAYVTAMATLFRDSLRPDVNVYVEHSNEVWNLLFAQGKFARARGLELNLSSVAATAGYRYHALRTSQIATIFRTVFSSAPGGGADRVKVVMGGWGLLCGTNGTGCGAVVLNETLGWAAGLLRMANGSAQLQQQFNLNVSLSKTDYFGITGYWGCGLGDNGPVDMQLSVEQMVAKCNSSLSGTEAAARALVAAATRYGVPLITYEAGPSIVETSAISNGKMTTGLAQKFNDLNRHPAMYGLYSAYLEAFRRAGLVDEGRPFMQFVSTGLFTQYGSWSLQEYTGQPVSQAPKYRSLMDWMDRQASGTAGYMANVINGTGPTSLRRPLCMSITASGGPAAGVSGSAGGGGVSLGEGVLAGPPAVYLPAAGQVVMMGATASVRWSTVGWAPGVIPPNFEITLWYLSDCVSDPPTGATMQQQQKNSSEAIAVLPTPTIPGVLDVKVPSLSDDPRIAMAVTLASIVNKDFGRRLPRFFLRFSDGITTNYSEPFDFSPELEYVTGNWSACDCSASPTPVQRRNVSCVPIPEIAQLMDTLDATGRLPAPPSTQPVCDPFPTWNISRSTIDPSCTIDSYGCRSYRTSNVGAWAYSVFKPVTDCTAQTSPWPLPVITGNASTPQPPGPPASFDLGVCESQLISEPPPGTQSCICGSSPGPSVLPSLTSSPPASSPSTVPPPQISSPAPPQPVVPFCSRGSTNVSLAWLNAGVLPCSLEAAEEQCQGDSVCTASSTCKHYVCVPETHRLIQVNCAALCMPRTLGVEGAQISDDGLAVFMALTAAPALLSRVPCSAVFDETSTKLLGGGAALCSTGMRALFTDSPTDPVIIASLPENATLQAGQNLTLLTNGSALVSILNRSRSFEGTAEVWICDGCVYPTAVVTGLSSVALTTCESASASLQSVAARRSRTTFDASQSSDPSGRNTWNNVTWALVSPSLEDLSDGPVPQAVTALMGAVERINKKDRINDRLVLALNSTEEEALSEGVTYTLQVTVTSWLNTTASAVFSFTVASNNSAPRVAVAGPVVQSARISSGLKLSADVKGGACKGRALTWNWTSPSNWAGMPASGQLGQQLTVKGPLKATHGQSITLRVTATYSGGASGTADVVVVAAGSPPLAVLRGPAGDVLDNTTLLFNATASSDPDAPNDPRGALKYSWDCRRSDYPTPCFSSAEQGELTQGLWTIAPGLLSTDIWHTITVAVYKEVAAEATPLSATASVSFRPRPASIPFPQGTLSRQCAAAACSAPHNTDRNLTVLLQLAAPYNTAATASTVTVTWASTDAPAVSDLTAIAATTNRSSSLPAGAFRLTIPAAYLPTTQSSITITANMAVPATATAAAVNGSATLTVPLNGPPYCKLSSTNASACFDLTMLDATFPSAAFMLSAQRWADVSQDTSNSQQLRYEFGVRKAITLAGGASIPTNFVQQLGTAASATLAGLPEGPMQLYGCAVDLDGSRSCAIINVTVAPPADGFNATAVLAAVNITDLLQANDQKSLLQAANQMAQVALMAMAASGNSSGSGNSSSAAVSELVGNMSVELVKALQGSGALQDAEQAPQAIAAMASLASSATSLPENAKDAFMSAVKLAVEVLGGGDNPNSNGTISTDALNDFVTQLCRLLGASLPSTTNGSESIAAGRRRALLDSQSDATRARLEDLVSMSNRIGNALGNQAVPGESYLASGDNGVYVSAIAIPTTSSSEGVTVNLGAGPNAISAASSSTSTSGSRRLLALASGNSDAEAQLVLAGAAAAAAGAAGYSIDLQYSPSSMAALNTALSTSLPANISLLSGLMTVTWNPGSGAAASPPTLDGNSNYLALSIPAPAIKSFETAACLLYNVSTNTVTGSLPGLVPSNNGTTATAVYDSSTGRLTCNVSAVGTYFVAKSPYITAIMQQGDSKQVDGGSNVVKNVTRHGKSRHVGVLVGGIIGGVVGLVLLAALVVVLVLMAKRRARQRQAAHDGGMGDGARRESASRSSVPPVDAMDASDTTQRQSIAEGFMGMPSFDRPLSSRLLAPSDNKVVPWMEKCDNDGVSTGLDGTPRAHAALGTQESLQ